MLSLETMKLTDSQSLPPLPDDLVYQIFKSLSVPERKNARLVCKKWHRVSNRRWFAQNEAFFISNVYELDTAVEVLVKCKRKVLNLKFDKRTFDQSSNVLWSRCGRWIQSLQFNSCKFPQDFVKQIFVNCKNLNEFSCEGDSAGYSSDDYEDYDIYVPWEKLILETGDDVLNPNLRTLHLNSGRLKLRECDLRFISSAFPQLNNLSIHFVSSEGTTTLTVLVNLLNSGLKNLEKLCVHLPYSWGPINFSSIPQFNCNRLKNVSMSLEPFIFGGDSLNKILRYKFWRSLKISGCALDMTNIPRLLNENPLLEELDMPIQFSTSSIFSNLFEALVKSRLKSLRINLADGGFSLGQAKSFIAAVTLLLEGLPCNSTVERLYVRSNRCSEFSSLFLQYFQNVLYLTMLPGRVNTVFKYQKNVKSLTIWPLAIQTDEPPVRRSIESLEFMDMRPLNIDIFTMYQFPNLKYLVVHDSGMYHGIVFEREDSFEPSDRDFDEECIKIPIDHNNSKEELVRKMNHLMSSIFRKSPHLEGIKFESDCLLDVESCTVFFQSCLNFHQLRYVSFSYSHNVSIVSYSRTMDKMRVAWIREVEKYFKKCPSFRGLWIDISPFNFSFYFNIVTKKYEFSYYDFKEHSPTCGPDFYNFWRYKR